MAPEKSPREGDAGNRQPRRVRRRRWIRVTLAILLLAALAAGWEARKRLDGWVRSSLERTVSRRFGGELRFGAFRLRLIRLEASFEDAELALPLADGRERRIRVGAGRVRFTRSGVLGFPVGRIRLAEVTLERPVVEWDRAAGPRGKGSSLLSRPLDLRIGNLAVHGAVLLLADREVPWDLEATGIAVDAEWRPEVAALEGRARFRLETRRAPLVRPLPLAVRTRFRARRHDIEILGLEARGEGMRGSLDANVRIAGRLSLVGRGEARVDLDVLRRSLDPRLPEIGGLVEGDFSVETGSGPLRVRADSRGDAVRFGRWTARQARASAAYSAGRLELSRFEGRSFGGEVSGAIEAEWSVRKQFRVDLRGRDLDAAALLAEVDFPLAPASRVEMELALEGHPATKESWIGSGAFRARAAPAGRGRVPVSGDGRFRLERGALQSEGRLAVGAADVTLHTVIHPASVEDSLVEFEGATLDARQTQLALIAFADQADLELPDALRRRIGGAGTFHGSVRGGSPRQLDLGLELERGRIGKRRFDRAALELKLDSGAFAISRLDLSRAEQRLSLSGRGRLVPLSLDEVQLEAEALDPGWVLDAVVFPVGLSGRLNASLRVVQEPTGRRGRGKVELIDGRMFGEPFSRLTGELRIDPDALHAPSITLEGRSVSGSGSGVWWTGEQRGELSLERGLVELGALAPVSGRELPVEGHLELAGDVAWTGRETLGELRMAGSGWSYGTREIGSAHGVARFVPGGLRARLETGEAGNWTADLAAEWGGDWPIELRLALEEALFEFGGGEPPPVWTRLSGEVVLSGPLRNGPSLALQGRVERAEIHSGAQRVDIADAFDVNLDDGQLRLSPIRVVGPETDATIQAIYDTRDGHVTASADGRVDLGLLTAAWPELRGSGEVRVALETRGPPTDLVWYGSLQCREGRLRRLGIPESVDRLGFRIGFDGVRATVHELTGGFGNGEIRASGGATIDGLQLADYSLAIEAANVRVPYPSGFRGVYEGRMTLSGGRDGAALGGDLRLLVGAYERNFDLGPRRRSYTPVEGVALPEVELDLRLAADKNLWVRNDLAELEAGLDLHLGGTLQRPELTGRVWLLEGGTIEYRDVEYDLLSGSLDLVDLDRLNPYLRLRAETRVKEYTVYLRVEGTLDRFDYELSSDPVLATPDIISLLATGNTLEEMTGEDPGANPLTGDLAANYFGGVLTAPFSRQLEKLTGLERVRIDPMLTQGESDPTTRLTLGKEVTDDVMVIFSTDLSRNERQLYQAEWRATRRFRFSVQRDTQGGVGGDIHYRKNFWLRAPPEDSVSVFEQDRGDGASETDSPPVSSVVIEGASEKDLDELQRRVPLRPGEPFSRSSLFAGAESLKRYYARRGRLEARVDASSTDRPDGVDVVYRVRPREPVELSFEGATKKERKQLRKRLEDLWIHTLFSDDLYVDAVDRLREFYHGRGYYAVDVTHETEERQEGKRVVFHIDRGKPVRVERVILLGAEQLSEVRIGSLISTRPSSTFTRRELIPAALDQDVAAIRALYHDEGLLRARVAPPVVSLSLTGEAAEIEIAIEEGPRSTIGGIEFPSGLPFTVEEMAGWAELEVGRQFSPAALIEAEGRIRREIDGRGYPDARVHGRYVADGTEVHVRFDIDPGVGKRVDELTIVGNHLTRPRVIRRELALEPGEEITRERLLRSQRRLYGLGIFRNVRLSYAPIDPDDPSAQRLEVAVQEGPPLTATVSAGYDTEADAVVTLSLRHDNVGGYDRILSLQGKVSGLERRIQLVGEDPHLFNHRLTGLAILGWDELAERGYDEERVTASFRMAKRLTPRWKGFVRYGLQDVMLSNVTIPPPELEQEKLVDGRFADLGAGLLRDTRDNPFDARRGTSLRFGTRVFARMIGSEFSFTKTDATWTFHLPTAKKTSLATAVRGGIAIPFGQDVAVPISEAYFAGGDSTIRGFQRDAVGPASGGELLLIFNQEFRYPIWRSLRGIVFYDAGNVYDFVSNFDPLDLRHVLGLGLRLETPVGPFRVEYGRKLDRKPNESGGELFFAIGAAF